MSSLATTDISRALMRVQPFNQEVLALEKSGLVSYENLKSQPNELMAAFDTVFFTPGYRNAQAERYFDHLPTLLHQKADEFRGVDDAVVIVTKWLDEILTGLVKDYPATKPRFPGIELGGSSQLVRWMDEAVPAAHLMINKLFYFLKNVLEHKVDNEDHEFYPRDQSKVWTPLYDQMIKTLKREVEPGVTLLDVLKNIEHAYKLETK